MSDPHYIRTRRACYYSYLAMSSVFVFPPMLFTTFHETYGISYTLLGSLMLANFATQLMVDLLFTFFSRLFNIRLCVRVMPLLTATGLTLFALVPTLWPQWAAVGLIGSTVIFSVASGLCEVLLSPIIAAIPSEHPDKDMSMLHSLYGWGVVTVVVVSSAFFALFGTKNWMILALFWAFLPLVSSVLFWVSPIPPMSLTGESGGGTQGGRTVRLALCTICIFLGAAAENTMTGWISSYMEKSLLVPKAVGDAVGLAMFALLLALTRTLYARYGRNILKTLLWGMSGAAVCYAVAGCVPNVIVAFIACIATGICIAMLWPGTLILMEETVPTPGVTAYALMAAGGDLGAAVVPQLVGALTDAISAGDLAANISATYGIATEQVGMKMSMLIAALFLAAGVVLLLVMRRVIRKPHRAE